ncbi:MAG: ATP-binding protein [Candidatus Zixiibacteriota bacterium]
MAFDNFSTKKLITISLRKLRHAVHYFGLLEDGDRVVIALSGGLDSTMLFYLLTHPKNNWMLRDIKFYPLHIDSGFRMDEHVWSRIAELCRRRNTELLIEKRDIESKAFADDAPFNPCFICSRMRRKAIFETAELLGANKVALGHHRDDVIETFFLNICFSREMAAIIPKQELFQGKYHLIRPFFLTDKTILETLSKRLAFPEAPKSCPMDGKSRREMIREYLKMLYTEDKNIKKNIFRSLFKPKHDYLLEKYSDLLSSL